MIRFRTAILTLAALAAATTVRAQVITPATPGVITIEHDGDRIEVRLPLGAAHPRITVNGEVVPTGEWKVDDGKHEASAQGWHFSTTAPSLGWQQPFVYNWSQPDQKFEHLWPTGTNATRPHIGVQVGSVPPALAEHLGLDADRCVLILSTTDGGPAATAGVKANDVLLAIDGTEGVTDESLSKAVADKKPGDKMTLQILRKGKRRDVEVEVGKETSGGWSIYSPTTGLDGKQWRTLINQGALDSFTPWITYKQFGAKDLAESGQGAPSTATIESLQQQIEQIKKLCDRLEQQIDRSSEQAQKRDEKRER